MPDPSVNPRFIVVVILSILSSLVVGLISWFIFKDALCVGTLTTLAFLGSMLAFSVATYSRRN